MKLTIDVVQKKHHMPEKTLQARMESAFFIFFIMNSLFFALDFVNKNLIDNWYKEKKDRWKIVKVDRQIFEL